MMAQIDTAKSLYYSDDPEQLVSVAQGRTNGVIFDFDLDANECSRFLFYHVNADAQPRVLALRAINITASPAVVSFVPSLPVAGNAYFDVGHRCTAGFISNLSANRWRSASIAPTQNVIIGSANLSRGALGAGL